MRSVLAFIGALEPHHMKLSRGIRYRKPRRETKTKRSRTIWGFHSCDMIRLLIHDAKRILFRSVHADKTAVLLCVGLIALMGAFQIRFYLPLLFVKGCDGCLELLVGFKLECVHTVHDLCD